MSGTVGFKNRDRFIQLGIAISTIRKMRGYSQEKLAELAHVSRSHISAIEAPGIAHPFSLEVFYNIADALNGKHLIIVVSNSIIKYALGYKSEHMPCSL